MRPALYATIFFLIFPALAFTQDVHTPQEWEKLYADASNQLRAAQDRKAALSAENATLAAQIKQLQKKLDDANSQIKSLKLQTDSFTERTYYLATYHLYWQAFLEKNPATRLRWELFLRATTPLQSPQWSWLTHLEFSWSPIPG